MIPYLLALLSAMFAATEQPSRCLSDAKDVLPDAKQVLDMDAPSPNPLDGWAPPPVSLPYLIPPATQSEFSR